jgi:CubicO group peptidase (beta-lactamase class C family)
MQWVSVVIGLTVILGGCAPQAAVSDREAIQAARERVERGLLPLVAVPGVPDSAFPLPDRMERYRVPGVSLTVIDEGRIAWSAAYGVREAGRPGAVTDTTLFQAGSISKAVAALTALRLVERGRLALDDDVNRTLRSWRVPLDTMTRGHPVTLRMLLSHSAGFNVPSFRGYERGSALPTLAQLLAGTPPSNTPAARVEVAPGTEWRYSGAGTEVVRQLIEDATGRRYEDVATEQVLAPAGMRLSGFSQRPDTLGREVAEGHTAGTPVAGGWLVHPQLAAAGLWSTSDDLARLGLALGASLRGARGGVLSQATMREAGRRQMGHWGLGFALGGGTGDSATFGHDGSTAGFIARLIMFADGRRGLAVMTNGESEALIDEIQRSVAAAYGWPVRPRPVRTAVRIAPEQLTGLAGRYRILVDDRTIDVAFTLAGGGLAFVGQSGRPAPLYAESPSRFFSRESGSTFTFDIDGPGPARGVTIDQPGQRFVAQRLP